MVQVTEGTFNIDGASLFTKTWLVSGLSSRLLNLEYTSISHTPA